MVFTNIGAFCMVISGNTVRKLDVKTVTGEIKPATH